MKQSLTYTTIANWPAMPMTGSACIIVGDYSRDSMGVLNQIVS